MANIILDEKRMVGIGEICAISLKNIHPINLGYDNLNSCVSFYPNSKNKISLDDEITFVKYIGNGMFMDLVSEQLLITEVILGDDFGTDEYKAMDNASHDEIEKMRNFWLSIDTPEDKSEFSNSFSIFAKNPLVIDIAAAPFVSINVEITKKFASQSLEQLRAKMISAKTMAQQGLKEQYLKYEGQFEKIISAVEKESAPKTK